MSNNYSLGVLADRFIDLSRIDLASIEVYIHIHWNGTNDMARSACVTSGIGHDDNLVPVTHTDGSEHDFECIGPVPQPNAMRNTSICGEGLLKGSHRGPADKDALVQQPLPCIK